MGRAAQGPRGLAASTAPLASSLGGPLYLLAKTAGGCLTKQKQRPLSPLSSCGALCTCWGVAHAVRDPAWRLCFKCSLLLAAASRQTAGPYGLSCPSTLGGWAGQKSGAGRSGPTRAGCEHSAPCLLSRRAVVSPREDSWRLPHETETASLISFVVLWCPVHVLGGRPRGTRPGLASLL